MVQLTIRNNLMQAMDKMIRESMQDGMLPAKFKLTRTEAEALFKEYASGITSMIGHRYEIKYADDIQPLRFKIESDRDLTQPELFDIVNHWIDGKLQIFYVLNLDVIHSEYIDTSKIIEPYIPIEPSVSHR